MCYLKDLVSSRSYREHRGQQRYQLSLNLFVGAWGQLLAIQIAQMSPRVLATTIPSLPNGKQVIYFFFCRHNHVHLTFLVSLMLICEHKNLCTPTKKWFMEKLKLTYCYRGRVHSNWEGMATGDQGRKLGDLQLQTLSRERKLEVGWDFKHPKSILVLD